MLTTPLSMKKTDLSKEVSLTHYINRTAGGNQSTLGIFGVGGVLPVGLKVVFFCQV